VEDVCGLVSRNAGTDADYPQSMGMSQVRLVAAPKKAQAKQRL